MKTILLDPIKRARLNGIILGIAVLGNMLIQAFCIPTTWATIVVTICFLNSIFYPLSIHHKKWNPIVSFICGISFCVFIYCILFLEEFNFFGLWGILFFGIGLLVYIPHFFMLQILWFGFIKNSFQRGKVFFLLGVFVSLIVPIVSMYQYERALIDINEFKESGYSVLEQHFMTEKILGIGIIYHTEFCEFDGWRPPKHEPLLNLGMWLNSRKDPLQIPHQLRVDLYRKFFPDQQVKFDCSCAFTYSQLYHNDRLWK